jgi:hypothetical protein
MKIRINAKLGVVILVFLWAYAMASFSNWELDCRKWSMLARWGVVWGGSIVCFLLVFLAPKEK